MYRNSGTTLRYLRPTSAERNIQAPYMTYRNPLDSDQGKVTRQPLNDSQNTAIMTGSLIAEQRQCSGIMKRGRPRKQHRALEAVG